jgi:predicted nucleotidyltransferase
MRLTPEEIAGIKAGAAAYFGAPVRVRLFGSRVNDKKKGGDIDLLIEVPPGRATFMDEVRCIGAIQDRIGERKVDVLLVEPGRERSPIEEIAYRDGVLLNGADPADSLARAGAAVSPEKRTLAQTIAAALRVSEALRLSLDDLRVIAPLSPERVWNLTRQEQKDVLAFLKSFEQLEDITVHRLIRGILDEMLIDTSRWSVRDAFDRMEKAGAIENAARFIEIARLRNRLVHEYPMDDARRAKRINDAWEAAPVLLEELNRLVAFARGLTGDAG